MVTTFFIQKKPATIITTEMPSMTKSQHSDVAGPPPAMEVGVDLGRQLLHPVLIALPQRADRVDLGHLVEPRRLGCHRREQAVEGLRVLPSGEEVFGLAAPTPGDLDCMAYALSLPLSIQSSSAAR